MEVKSLREQSEWEVVPCCRWTGQGPGCATQGWSSRAIETRARRSTTSFMARKTDAYVDTSALIALADRSDTYHHLFRRLFADPPRLVTTALVVVLAIHQE